jgi:hypothetical protein
MRDPRGSRDSVPFMFYTPSNSLPILRCTIFFIRRKPPSPPLAAAVRSGRKKSNVSQPMTRKVQNETINGGHHESA